MTCRRKTCSERALVADIRKTFTIYCNNHECAECDYKGSIDCVKAYVIDLLNAKGEEWYENKGWFVKG